MTTIYGSIDPPADPRVGDVWVQADTGYVFRSVFGPACPTCQRPGPQMWERVEDLEKASE